MDELLTATEVARRFRVSAATVYNWARDGIIPEIRRGGVVRFRTSDIEAILNPTAPDPESVA